MSKTIEVNIDENLINENKHVEVNMFTLLRVKTDGDENIKQYIILEFPLQTTNVSYEFYTDDNKKKYGSIEFNRFASSINNLNSLCIPVLSGKHFFLKCSFKYQEIEHFEFDFFEFFKNDEQIEKKISFQKQDSNNVQIAIEKRQTENNKFSDFQFPHPMNNYLSESEVNKFVNYEFTENNDSEINSVDEVDIDESDDDNNSYDDDNKSAFE